MYLNCSQMQFPAIRVLLARPGLSTLVILAVALGAVVTTSICSLIRGILMRPFPYPEPACIFRIETRLSRSADATRRASVYFSDRRKHNRAFTDAAGYISFNNSLEGPGGTQPVAKMTDPGNLFRVTCLLS